MQYGDREARSLAAALYPMVPSFFSGVEVLPSLLHGDLWGGNAARVDDEPGNRVWTHTPSHTLPRWVSSGVSLIGLGPTEHCRNPSCSLTFWIYE